MTDEHAPQEPGPRESPSEGIHRMDAAAFEQRFSSFDARLDRVLEVIEAERASVASIAAENAEIRATLGALTTVTERLVDKDDRPWDWGALAGLAAVLIVLAGGLLQFSVLINEVPLERSAQNWARLNADDERELREAYEQGILAGQVDEHERDIERHEGQNDEMGERLSRVEGTLQALERWVDHIDDSGTRNTEARVRDVLDEARRVANGDS